MTLDESLAELVRLGAHIHEGPKLALAICVHHTRRPEMTPDLVATIEANRVTILQMYRGHRFSLLPLTVWRPKEKT